MTSEDDYLWPERGVNIVKGKNEHQFLALLQWQHAPDLRGHSYIAGYRRAAEVLFGHIRDGDARDQDILFYPLALIWRQHMELQLKSTLMELQRLGRKPVKAPTTHDLATLWQDVKAAIKKEQPHDIADLPHVEKILLQLHNMDRSGEEFRYHETRKGTPSLAGVPQVDLEAFHNGMVRLPTSLMEKVMRSTRTSACETNTKSGWLTRLSTERAGQVF